MFNSGHIYLGYFYLILILISLSLSVSADEKKAAPEAIQGTTKVSAEGVLNLAEKIPDLILIDARIAGDRKQGYIEGSISLPDIDTNCNTLAQIIPKKGSPVLFYCNGVKCGRSVISSRIAVGCGYKNIYWFRGGVEEWKAKGFPSIKK